MSTAYATLLGSIFQADITFGVPSSGKLKPSKQRMREELGPALDSSFDALTAAVAGKQDASAKLSAIAALTWANKKLFRLTGTGTLDLIDYEEGVWTPTLTFATPGDLSVSYAMQTGTFQRRGNRVDADVILTCTPTWTTASSTLRIAGLPFAPAVAYNAGLITDLNQISTWPSSLTMLFFKTTAAQSYLKLAGVKAAGVAADVSTSQVTSGNAVTIAGSLTYRI